MNDGKATKVLKMPISQVEVKKKKRGDKRNKTLKRWHTYQTHHGSKTYLH